MREAMMDSSAEVVFCNGSASQCSQNAVNARRGKNTPSSGYGGRNITRWLVDTTK